MLRQLSHALSRYLLLGGAVLLFAACEQADHRGAGIPVTPLMGAVIERDEVRVRELLSQGVPVNQGTKYNETALMFAAGVHLNQPERDMAKGERPAKSWESPAIVELLLANGANPNTEDADGRTPLSAAIFHGWTRTARLLLKRGANPNHVNLHGSTPLMYAALRCYDDIAAMLLAHGADPAIVVPRTGTVLDVAIEYNCEPVKLLLQRPARSTGQSR